MALLKQLEHLEQQLGCHYSHWILQAPQHHGFVAIDIDFPSDFFGLLPQSQFAPFKLPTKSFALLIALILQPIFSFSTFSKYTEHNRKYNKG